MHTVAEQDGSHSECVGAWLAMPDLSSSTTAGAAVPLVMGVATTQETPLGEAGSRRLTGEGGRG